MIYRLPRFILAAIATICAACIVLAITGLTSMYLDADARAERALDERPPAAGPAPPPARDSELDELRELFAYCQQRANWATVPCSTTDASDAGSVRTVYERIPDNDDEGDDTRIVVETDDDPAASPRPTTPPRTTSPPAADDVADPLDEVADVVEDTTETVEEITDRLADVTASAVAERPSSTE
jgi:hypothetical protein